MLPESLDHLVFATANLDESVELLSQKLGVRAFAGGAHPGRGTRNALLALGPSSYLEIVGPDPDQADFVGLRWFGIDAVQTPRLVTWAAKGTHLTARRASAEAGGVHLGAVRAGKRLRGDGVLLSWELTDPTPLVDDGIVPFLIDWGTSPHPAANAAHGLHIRSLRSEHAEVGRVQASLRAVGISLEVAFGERAALIAEIDGPLGTVELR